MLRTLWIAAIEHLNLNESTSIQSQNSDLYSQVANHTAPIYPYKPLPNVRKFKVKQLAPYHPVFEQAGILKREFSPLFETEQYNNKRLNRYIKHQWIRLNRHRTNPRTFWAIAGYLLHKSIAYRVCCINAVFPNWHRSMPYGKVWKIIQSLYQLGEYEYHITEIPKGNGEMRPLGVPSPSWRIYQHGLNNLCLTFLSPLIPENQHGFFPGRGTMTAWQQILEETLTSPNIYEFDLRKFFDSVSLDYLGKLLTVAGIPSNIVTEMLKWNRTAPNKGLEPQV